MIYQLTIVSGSAADLTGFVDGQFGTCAPAQIQSSRVLAVYDDDATSFILTISGIVQPGSIATVTIPSSDSGPITFAAADASRTVVNGDTTWAWAAPGALFTYGQTYAVNVDDGQTVEYNCSCDDQNWDSDTLLNLRRRMLVRLGYAAQANNPPPGMAELIDDFLSSAQRYLYQKYASLRQERFFSWRMTPGVRFYDFADTLGFCAARLKSDRIIWSGVEDDNQFWSPLVYGIPPEYYTSANQPGFPCRYEIRQCIEVFPAPDKAYTLRIKAASRLDPLEADTDRTSIEAEVVFLWALANAKNHYRHADASDVAAQANTYLATLVAGKHGTQRYVPQAYPLPAEPKPVFIPLQNP